MPRQQGDISRADFSSGFITETGPLGYPDNACKDIDNLVLERNGSVRVRNGLVVPKVLRDSNLQITDPEDVVSVHVWENAGNTDRDFLVVQVGDLLHVLSIDTENVGDDSFRASSVDPSTGAEVYSLKAIASPEYRSLFGVQNAHKQVLNSRTVQGKLYMANEDLGAFYLRYLPDGREEFDDSIFDGIPNLTDDPTAQIVFCDLKVRDFEGVEDGLDIDENPSSLTELHKYNLYNQGWDNYTTSEHQADVGVYPSNAEIPYVGSVLNDSGDPTYSGERTRATNFGNTPAPKGHFIGRVYELDRNDKVNTTTIPSDGSAYGPSSVSSFAGRAWYAGFVGRGLEETVLFSTVLVGDIVNQKGYEDTEVFVDKLASQCYQQQDPTVEDLNDLLDNDGGSIIIPGCGRVVAMVPVLSSLIVIATNGVWSIGGGLEGFSATSFEVSKVTDVGGLSESSVISAEGVVAYWSNSGIYIVTGDQQTSKFVAKSLTEPTIDRFYGGISLDNKRLSVGYYDDIERKLYWLYPSEDGEGIRDRILIFDVVMRAFTKYSFPGSLSYPLGPEDESDTEDTKKLLQLFNTTISSNTREPYIAYLNTDNYIEFATFDSEDSANYHDWVPREVSEVLGIDPIAPVKAYIEIGDNSFGDLMREKQALYVYSYLESLEKYVIPQIVDVSIDDLDYTTEFNDQFFFLNKANATLQGRWAWHVIDSGGRWSKPQQIYREIKALLPDYDAPNDLVVDLSDYDTNKTHKGFISTLSKDFPIFTQASVSVSRVKIRGRGKSLNLYYENAPGEGFKLLGWASPISANANV